jgi:hypothetical protein
MEAPGDARLVATAAAPRGVAVLQAVLWPVMTVSWTLQARASDSGLHVGLAVAAACLSVWWIAVLSGGQTARLFLADESLEVRRPIRSYRIPRAEVVAVHGNFEEHLSWSEQVVLETTTGRRPLPVFAERPTKLVPLLEDWIAQGEPDDRAP